MSAASIATVLLAAGFTAAPAQAADGTDDPAKALHLGAKEKLIPRDTITDPDGTVHTRYERTYDGLPVLGGDVVVHQAKKNGEIEDVDKATNAAITVPTTKPKAAPPAARNSLAANVAPRKVIWAAEGKPVLAYETIITGVQPDGTPSRVHLITDATTGKKLSETQDIDNGTGTGEYNGKVTIGTVKAGAGYLMKDTARGGHQPLNARHKFEEDGPDFRNSTDKWGDGKPGTAQTAAVDVQYGAAVSWGFYKNVFGRKGFKNDGKASRTLVHYGKKFANSFWDTYCECMAFGDGKDDKHPVTSLDLVGHEMTHGVMRATADFKNSGESSGLSEGTSDILGTAIEFYNAKSHKYPANYLIGEQVNLTGDGKPMRYLDKPSRDGKSADYWSPKVGKLEGHNSSGVANHFFYLLAEGSGKKTINGIKYNSPTYNGKKVTGIGREAAAKIWYKALTTYMTSTTDYKGARSATLKAAKALYGRNSTQYRTVAAAWTAVNVR